MNNIAVNSSRKLYLCDVGCNAPERFLRLHSALVERLIGQGNEVCSIRDNGGRDKRLGANLCTCLLTRITNVGAIVAFIDYPSYYTWFEIGQALERKRPVIVFVEKDRQIGPIPTDILDHYVGTAGQHYLPKYVEYDHQDTGRPFDDQVEELLTRINEM